MPARNAGQPELDPSSLSVQDAARLLNVNARDLQADIEAGAPTNANGSINLVHYAAWLNLQLQEGPDG